MAAAIIPDSEIAELESKLGVEFSNPDLLRQAMTHESFVNEWGSDASIGVRSYERLEYLGDAVLNFTVAKVLFESSDDATEGEMSMGRAHVVCKDSLARAAQRLDLGDHILRGKGEEAYSPNVRDSVLEDSFEAVIGAIYVDQGFAPAREFVLTQLSERIDHVIENGVDKDPKSAFQELVQGAGLRTPRYRTEAAGYDSDGQQQYRARVLIGGKEVAAGLGISKSKAQMSAAEKAQARFAAGVPSEFAKARAERPRTISHAPESTTKTETMSVRVLAAGSVRRLGSLLSLSAFRKREATPGRQLIYKRPE